MFRFKKLIVFLVLTLVIFSSNSIVVNAQGRNQSYEQFNTMLMRLFEGNATNIIVLENGLDITNDFINEYQYLYNTNQLSLISDYVADYSITFSEPSANISRGIQTGVYTSSINYGVAVGTSSLTGKRVTFPFTYHIVITSSYNDATGKVTGSPRVSVQASSDGVGDTINVTDIIHTTSVINNGYDVQCTKVSFILKVYGALDWGVWQTYDRFTWNGNLTYSPAGV